MAKLFKRFVEVRVHTFRTSGLDVAFEVEKSTKREPNKCTLKLWNLNRTHRRELEALSVARGQGRIRVEIDAGYEQSHGLIFRGDLRSAVTERDSADLITTLEGEDGGRASLWGRVNQSFPPGTLVETVVRACAQAMGVGIGNAPEVLRGATFSGGGNTFTAGTVLSGPAADELRDLLRSMGLRYSIQDGVLQVLQRGRALQATAVKLSPSTGLIDRPSANANGVVLATSLLQPDLYPGRRVLFEGVDCAGLYRVERVKYSGDTAGDNWLADLECEPLLGSA